MNMFFFGEASCFRRTDLCVPRNSDWSISDWNHHVLGAMFLRTLGWLLLGVNKEHPDERSGLNQGCVMVSPEMGYHLDESPIQRKTQWRCLTSSKQPRNGTSFVGKVLRAVSATKERR